MNVNIQTIQARFDDVLHGRVGREVIADWAKALREADDHKELTVVPETDRLRVWKAILFLEGVDLRDSPESYLHDDADISRERP